MQGDFHTPSDVIRLDNEFHICIAQAGYNSCLITMITNLAMQCQRASAFHNMHNVTRINRSIDQHEAILRAIADGDPEEASEAMKRHMEDLIRSTKEIMSEYYYMYQ